MSRKTYYFDAVLVTSTLPMLEKDTLRADGGRIYSIRLFDDFEELPVDRLYVECFPDGPPLARFTASPCELIGSLTTKGVGVGLTENAVQTAAGRFMLGPLILRQLTDPTFSVTECVTVDLVKGKNTVCTVELMVKISSVDPDVKQHLVPFGAYDVCRPAERGINKNDIIFTLGRSGKCATSTCITDERLMSHAGAPHPCPHAAHEAGDNKGGADSQCGCYVAGMQLPNDEQEAKKRERAALKKLVSELGLNKVKVPKPPDTFEKSRRWNCSTSSSTVDTSSSSEFQADRPRRKRKALSLTASMEQQARRRIMGPCPVVPQPELKSEVYKPPHLCQLCQSDISWLPKISACPYCGYKTFEDIPASEEPYDLTATAQQLLQDCLRKQVCEISSSPSAVNNNGEMGNGHDDAALQDDDPNIPKQCLCMGGKPCTRCRIRKLCDNFLKDTEVKAQLLPQAQVQGQERSEVTRVSKAQAEVPRGSKAQAEVSRGSKAQSQPVQDQEPKQPQRSELISIFTEMRNMYGRAKSDAQAEKLHKECDAICRGTKTSKARRKARKALQKVLAEIDRAYPKPTRKRVKKRVQRHKSKCYTFLKVQKRPTDPRIGHVACISDGACSGYCKVPCHMGWMWTKSEMARFKSWRPGSISKPIRQMMSYFLSDYPADDICISRYHYLRRKRRSDREEQEEPLVQHPTLHISRKGDEYIITLRPLKDPKALALCADPYADMKPVVFRITKDPIAVATRELKAILKEKGFPPCTCGRPVASCFCRSHIDKKRIQYEVEQQCRLRRWTTINSDSFVYSDDDDDDDSEQEYEFGVTPPAGIIKPERVPKPDRAHVETQYMEEDWVVPTMYPHPANMLVQFESCAMGEREKEFKWLYGKGNIHAPPKKPVMLNSPKKSPKKGLPFRSAGGFDDPRRFDPTPLNRPWIDYPSGRLHRN